MSNFGKAIRSSTGKILLKALSVSVIAKVAQLAMSIIAARLLHPTGFGIFTFALGVGLLGGRLAGLGWPVLMNRFVPFYSSKLQWGLLRGFIISAHGVLIISTLCFLALCVLMSLLSPQDGELKNGLLLGAFLIPIMAFRNFYRLLLASLKSPQNGILIDELLPPLLMTAALFGIFKLDVSPNQAIWLYVISSGIAVLVGAVWIFRLSPREIHLVKPQFEVRLWMLTALPAMVGMSARLLMNKTDVLMLAPLGTMEEVGLYGAALRATYVQTAGIAVLSTVVASKISEAFSKNNPTLGIQTFYWAIVFSIASSAPFGLVLFFWSKPIMMIIFGSTYVDGSMILSILAVSQIGAAANIPLSSFMIMTGRQVIFGTVTMAALAMNVIGNLLLIPDFGAEGAAFATSASIFFLTFLQIAVCGRIIRSGEFLDAVKKRQR